MLLRNVVTLAVVGVIAVTGLAACTADDPGYERPGSDMPALSESYRAQQDFYRIEFLEDGYPGRDDGWAHPIYGVYVLWDYLRQHAADTTEELERGLSTYSGLTQGYYAPALNRVGERLDDAELLAAAERVFRSLTIPVEDGGVLHRTRFGPVIAEVPQEPNSWILNGWQSALTSVHEYAELSGSSEARELFAESAAAMAKVLPLYDVPDLEISRYGLSGFTRLRITPAGRGAALTDASIVVPGEPPVPVATSPGTRWQNHFLARGVRADADQVRVTGRHATMNAVLSLASSPRPNRLEFGFDAPEAMDVRVQASVGAYDPLSSSPVETEWVEVDTVEAEPGTTVAVDIPLELLQNVAYPTNFAKVLEGKNTNVYHSIHFQRLRDLADASRIAELSGWADRWERYQCSWPDREIYAGLHAATPPGDVC